MNTKKKMGIGFFVSLVLILLDQLTKWLAIAYLKDQDPIPVIPGVFEFRYLENHGAAFGIMQEKQLFFIIMTSVMLVVLAVIFSKVPQGKRFYPMNVVMVALFAGAIGNFIDRLRFQYVVDFLYFKLIDFPIFNIADCYVTVSVFVFVFLILFYYKEEELGFLGLGTKKKKESENE